MEQIGNTYKFKAQNLGTLKSILIQTGYIPIPNGHTDSLVVQNLLTKEVFSVGEILRGSPKEQNRAIVSWEIGLTKLLESLEL